MPSAVLVDQPSTADTASGDNYVISIYLAPLLAKHAKGRPLIYEDLLTSYEVASAIAANASPAAKAELEKLHQSQLAAYEECAKAALAELALARAHPYLEAGESMPAYIERFVASIQSHHQMSYGGWRVSESVLEEAFWSKVKSGARRAYFAMKGRSLESKGGKDTKDTKEEAGQTTSTAAAAGSKVAASETAALGALVSKSESTDLDMNEDEEVEDDEDDDNGLNNDGEQEEADDDEERDEEDEEADKDDNEEEDGEEEAPGAGADDARGNVSEAATKPQVNTKKRRRLPNGPLGGGGAAAVEGGKKQQQTKKLKTGKGSGTEVTGGAGRGSSAGRGKGAKGVKGGRGGGGGRGGRKKSRKKGTGAGAGGVA